MTARLFIAATILALAPTAATADIVLSGGAEVVLGERDAPTPFLAAGGFVRLAQTAAIPSFTTAPRGYKWGHGLGIDATLRGGDIEGEEYSSGLLGIRYDITFSQRRTGLLGVSGGGGFYLVGRTGVIRSSAFDDVGSVGVLPASLPSEPPRDSPPEVVEPSSSRLVVSGALGSYVRFGNRVRMISEFGVFRIGKRGEETLGGVHFRFGLGIDLSGRPVARIVDSVL